MQFSTVMLAFAAAVAAAPAPSLISVTNLYISSFAYSHDAHYQANVSYTGQSGYSSLTYDSYNGSSLCQKTSTYAYAPAINGFVENQYFDNQAFTWAIIPDGSDGYVFNVNYTSSAGEVYQGSRALPSSDFYCSGQSDIHAQDGQNYGGAKNFTMSVTQS